MFGVVLIKEGTMHYVKVIWNYTRENMKQYACA